MYRPSRVSPQGAQNGAVPVPIVTTAVRLPVRLPFAADALSAALRAHAVPGLETADGAVHRRALGATPGPALVEFDLGRLHPVEQGRAELPVRLHLSDPADADEVTAVVRRWLALDDDIAVVEAALATDPTIGPLIARRPGLRVAGAVSAAECLLFTVLGQQVSLAAARKAQERLVAAYGRAVDLPGGPWRLGPSPEAVAATDPDRLREDLRLTGARARSLHTVAVALTDGLFNDVTDLTVTKERLLALPGIGPWTTEYVALRALGDRDAFTPGDAVLRRALGGAKPAGAEALSQTWRPWRAYASTHLWTEAAYCRQHVPTVES